MTTHPNTDGRPAAVSEPGEVSEYERAGLVARLRMGDREALGQLYRLYRPSVQCWLARRMAVCPQDVEDVVHETFLRAGALAGEFSPERGTVGAWLHGLVAARALTDHLRHYRFRYLAGADAAADIQRRGLAETAEERESRPLSPRVVTALAGLTPARRRAVQLRYLEGLSEDAAAQVTGNRPHTIGRHTYIARRQLREQLADLAPTPTSWLHTMSKKQAVHAAFQAVGRDDPPAVLAWLRERGVRVAHQYVYQIKLGQHGPPPTFEAATAGSATDAPPASTGRVDTSASSRRPSPGTQTRAVGAANEATAAIARARAAVRRLPGARASTGAADEHAGRGAWGGRDLTRDQAPGASPTSSDRDLLGVSA